MTVAGYRAIPRQRRKKVAAVLIKDCKIQVLDYILFKGTLVELLIYKQAIFLFVNDACVDTNFPPDAAELLE